jgi:hypothetical protein
MMLRVLDIPASLVENETLSVLPLSSDIAEPAFEDGLEALAMILASSALESSGDDSGAPMSGGRTDTDPRRASTDPRRVCTLRSVEPRRDGP